MSRQSLAVPMDVIVLAGGFGTRLRPWTNSAPKPLLPILDRTMIEHVVDILPVGMVDRVLIAAGFGIDQMRRHFASVDLPYEVLIIEETEPLGTGGAIANCREHLGAGTFCVINGDLLTSVAVDDMLALHQAKGGLGTISLWEVEDPSRFGVADFDADRHVIRRFQEKPKLQDAYSNLINAGTYILEPEVFDMMPDGAFSMERVVFPEMAQNGQLHGFPFEGHFVDAGTPASYIEACQVAVAGGRWVSGKASTSHPRTWTGEGVVIAGDAEVSGSAVGGAVVIGAGVRLTNSACLSGSSIGAGSVVESCMVGKEAVVGADCMISDMVIDHGSQIPDGHHQKGGMWPSSVDE